VSASGARKILESFPCHDVGDLKCSPAFDWHLSSLVERGVVNAYGMLPQATWMPKQGELVGIGAVRLPPLALAALCTAQASGAFPWSTCTNTSQVHTAISSRRPAYTTRTECAELNLNPWVFCTRRSVTQCLLPYGRARVASLTPPIFSRKVRKTGTRSRRQR